MRRIRIYTPQALTAGLEFDLETQATRHLVKVLRLKAGSPLVVFNGDGREFPATLVDADPRAARVLPGPAAEPNCESALRINLAICLSRGDRMDHIIQKSTELGVASISPLFSSRTEVRLNEQRRARKEDHWRQIAISACEQSGRAQIPNVAPIMQLENWIYSCEDELKIVMHHRAERALDGRTTPSSLSLLIGPEGGLTDSELAQAVDQGFMCLALGPRVLRTETAPTAAIAILQYIWGDLN
ncbi:MAG: 16S rRNA (uracil1498-N3)-methyltransferase [Halieaceae bacterium]|jgi:16S rRNA (uracil1498-N3)-methyltransferase